MLAECAAAPDDDAPRLVWADLVGGERGELVVIQCDLARGNLSLVDARARRLRERELLERNAVAWAGELARVATRWSFRRGFIEAARLSTLTSSLRAWPLLRSITVGHWPREKQSGLDELRALGVGYLQSPGNGFPIIPRLRALSLDGLDDDHAASALDMIASAPIETLHLRRQRLYRVPIARLLDAAPHLVALELTTATFGPTNGINAAASRPLRALRLGAVRMRELALLERCPASATLEHLAFDLVGDAPGLAEILSAFRHLRSVEIGGNIAAAAGAVGNADLPGLRVLRLCGEISPQLLRDIDSRFTDLEQLDNAPAHDELLHESPDAMGTLGAPWFEWSRPAVLAWINRREIFDVPAVPADEHILLGRGRDLPICLPSSMVARRHAALLWRDGMHVLKDLGGTNGIMMHGERIDSTALRDGDELAFGDVTLRYFVGPGARERADAAISESSTR